MIRIKWYLLICIIIRYINIMYVANLFGIRFQFWFLFSFKLISVIYWYLNSISVINYLKQKLKIYLKNVRYYVILSLHYFLFLKNLTSSIDYYFILRDLSSYDLFRFNSNLSSHYIDFRQQKQYCRHYQKNFLKIVNLIIEGL